MYLSYKKDTMVGRPASENDDRFRGGHTLAREPALRRGSAFVCGDWGTSHLRLFLCSDGKVLERRDGPGIAQLEGSPAATLFGLLSPWVSAHGRMPVRLAGMIGSRNGWREVPYVACPADARMLAAGRLRFVAEGHDISIAPGLSCVNGYGAPDVMRGEETQIVGAFVRDAGLATGSHLLVLPGTHTKWALVEDGRIVSFQTSLTGELFALLRDHSTLARAGSDAMTWDAAQARSSFALGLARSRDLEAAPLTHLLFEVRSRQLCTDMRPQEALAFLSGLIIGKDVLGATKLFSGILRPGASVCAIGSSEMTELYATALAAHDIQCCRLDAAELTRLGLDTLEALAELPQ